MGNSALKQQQHDTWESVAPGWARWDERLRRLTQPVTDRLAEEVRQGDRVLDVSSGVGEPAITLAEHVGPSGSVLGTDLVEAMIESARVNAAARGASNVEFRKMDGERLDVPAGSFDAAIIRWGLMFMPDPLACLSRVKAALRPGGRLALTVWAGPDRNPWVALPMRILLGHLEVPPPEPGAPGIFALADWERLQDIIESASFTNVLHEELALPMSDTDSGAEYLRLMLDLAGPIASLFARVPEEERQAVFDVVARACEEAGSGSARLCGVTWIATATA